MVTEGLQKLAVRLCLFAATLIGLTPVPGLVLCIEPDGTAALEIGTSRGCAACPGVAQDSTTPVLRIEASKDCPCLDIPLSAETCDARISEKPNPTTLQWMLAASPLLVGIRVSRVEEVTPTSAPSLPRPAPLLAHIRSVVLLV
jgi:hypothetical protein